jgi:hypothetical protein
MTTWKTVRPSQSYLIALPEEVRENHDGRVSSFWTDGKPLLLQLSSYLRTEGEQVGARTRLRERLAIHPENWIVWTKTLYPDAKVDQVTAEFLDEKDVLWVHTYLVWPHVTIYALVSGPAAEVRNPNNWAVEALKGIRLSVH